MHALMEIVTSKIWVVIFLTWALLLSGVFSPWMGPPGLIQSLRLKNLLQSKHELAQHIESERDRLEGEFILLESNRVVQEHEIRRVLGYVAQDEIVFDFSAGENAISLVSVR